jgi:hypothetical protein
MAKCRRRPELARRGLWFASSGAIARWEVVHTSVWRVVGHPSGFLQPALRPIVSDAKGLDEKSCAPLLIPQLFFNHICAPTEHRANHKCCLRAIEDNTHESNTNICHFGNFDFRNGFRPRGKHESNCHALSGNSRASRRAIKQRRS